MGVSTGLSVSGVIMTLLEFCSVILFLIGGLRYYKLAKLSSSEKCSRPALAGVISACIGGLPNACDKLCWTFFSYDTWFNSTWMFFFVGTAYILLFISAVRLFRTESSSGGTKLFSLPAGTALYSAHKIMKYCSMLAASVGMLCFYITMCKKTRALIGGKAFLYLVTLFTTVFLIVWSAAATFTSPLPNIIAQVVNSLGYAAFIIVNGLVIRSLDKG